MRVGDPLPEWVRRAPASNPDPRAAARALRPALEAGAAEGERTGRLTDEVVRALADSGLFGLRVPRELGGIEADPATYIDVIEELSYADGSAGWVMMATTFGTGGGSVSLGPSVVEQMYREGAGYVSAGQVAPLGKATRVGPDRYRISGRFQFGSGAQIASWFFGAYVLHEDGRPALDEKARPRVIWAFAPRSQVVVHEDTWDVTGLRATGSFDYEVLEHETDDEHVMMPTTRQPRGGPAFAVGVSIAHVSWALGVGARALDELKALAGNRQRPGRATLIDQPAYHGEFARMTASMDAARALVHVSFDDWYRAAQHGRADLEVRARARLAACWATDTAGEAARFAYHAAGSDGLRNDPENRIQRCFRDLTVGATHKHVDENVRADCGSVLLGVADDRVVL